MRQALLPRHRARRFRHRGPGQSEYDTLSGKFAEFIEAEVLPAVEQRYDVRLTRDPAGRAVMGCSSGAAAAFTMAWFHPEWYSRVISYSGTFVNQQWPFNPDNPAGAVRAQTLPQALEWAWRGYPAR